MVTNKKRRAIVLGIHSFASRGRKVGIQYIAEGLAQDGWVVDYISIFSSPFDLIGKERRQRFFRVWIKRQDINGIAISKNLTEYAFRAFWPATKLFFRWKWQSHVHACLAPQWLGRVEYDLCVHDVTPNVLYLPKIHARTRVFRVNDWYEGFSRDLPCFLLDTYARIAKCECDEIWAAHGNIVDRLRSMEVSPAVIHIPNGLDPGFANVRLSSRKEKRAVYVGAITYWVDLDLLDRVAELLPDWRIDLYGPLEIKWSARARNLTYGGVLDRREVLQTLPNYSVGLIPYIDIQDRTATIEIPLKFYEYIASGLSVVATDIRALRRGIGRWAAFAKTPEEFAAKMETALERGGESEEMVRAFIDDHSWTRSIDAMGERIDQMRETH